MEGRVGQDGGAVRRSGVFSGRQVPLEMGTVRVGGSGRPVTALLAAAASRHAGTATQEAVVTSTRALSPRVALEPHPRSPFRRQDTFSETVVRIPEDASASRFHVKKVTVPHPLSARSPQLRFKGNASMTIKVATSTEWTTSRQDGTEVSMTGDGVWTDRAQQATRKSPFPETSKALQQQEFDAEEQLAQSGNDVSEFDLILTEEQTEEVDERAAVVNTLRSDSEDTRPPELPSRPTLALPSAKAGAGTFVSSMPSLTKLRSSFTARELALFTQRLDTSDDNAQTRYHVASHPHSAAAASSTLALQTNPIRAKSHDAGRVHKRTLSSSVRRSRASQDESREVETSWRQVDTSIDHIYEDPSIDQVHLHLLQSQQSSSGQKKRKMVERQRVLAAASGLREHQSEEQRRQEELQQRKLQLQKMSEAIRLQNQRAVRARAVHSAGLEARRSRVGRRSDKEPTLPDRKPPVPRLSRVGSSSKRTRKPKHETCRPQGEVSASILMELTASSSVTATQQEVVTAEEATSREEDPTPPAEYQQVTKRKPAVTTPRLTKRKKQGATVQPPVNEAAVRAREERRAIAREYMQMQKQSRRIWSAKAKEQSQREQEKRQQQLEILEATRLKNLRLSKKRPKDRQKPEIDYVLPEDDCRTTTVALFVAPAVSQVLEDVNISTLTKPGRESNDRGSDDLDEPNVDNENDQAIGNVRARENSLHFDTGVASSVVKSRSTPQPHHEQTNEADERVRKLLELREKAAALSARLRGLRNRTDKPETENLSQETLEHGRLTLSLKHEDAASESEQQSPFQRPINHELVSCDDRQHSTESGRVERERELSVGGSDSGDNDHSSEGGSGKAFSRRSESSSDHHNLECHEDADAEPTQSSLLDDEYESLTITRSRQVIQHDQAVHFDATDGVASYDESGDGDIDVRSIGVYNIGVVWPLEQHQDAGGVVPETQRKSRSKSSSSSDSSASATSAASRREEWREQFGDDMNESNDEAFEVEFYQQLKNKLAATTAAVDQRNEDTTASYVDESGEEVKSKCESDSDSDILESVAVQSSRRRLSAAARSVVSRQQSTSPSPPNAGLMRLLREADDSLSVIDREARKLYREQQERSEREKEAELQKRIEAEKKELIEKDMALEAVMATLTRKKAASEASDVDDDVHSCDEETDLQAAQYKRLEEIMDEVEQERARESGSAVPDEPTPSASEAEDTREPTRGLNPSDRVPASPSSNFWDHMVSASTVNEFSDYRPRVKIDDSELVAQREAQLREDEQKDGCVDSPPRVHSPRTLSRRLMAAVDYQETIFEAHMQLNMMEHAQELETVQAETITLAQAFKEEMEQNATSHQLALDHATLEKKFDGDLHEVVQQLDTIRQVEEQERAAYESRMEQELRLANLRECSVQTETSQRVDAATSAALYVDVSTSPLRSVVDAAVQHETAEQSPAKEASVAEYDNDLEYASEEESNAYDETFEKESQVQVEAQVRRKTSTSDVPSIADSMSHSLRESEKDSESEIQSVLSERDDDLEESATAKSIADEESFAEESAMTTGAVESVIDDEVHGSDSDHSTTRKQEGSDSMEYEDDFAASSPTMKAMASAVESAIDDDIHENESNRSTTSKYDVSASMEYEDDFEASSPKMKVIPNRSNRINQEASVEDAVIDQVLESDESREHSQEDVESVSDDSKSGEEVLSDDVESDHYSSQLEDRLHDVSMDEKKRVPKPAVTSNAKTSTVQKPDLELDITQPSDSVAATYIRDLERRKQAEESLLDLRLQAVKQKHQRELKQLGNGLGNELLDARVARELKIREETLTMAFLAETANVESLKAASTARYYHDLHAFRSLSLDWPHSAAPNDGQSHQYGIAVSEHAPPPAFPGPSDGENSALAERTGEYDDDFASDAGDSHGKVDDNVSSHISASIDTEHSEMRANTSESSDVPDASDVADEEDLEQANKEGPSDSLSEEEEEYGDEFASIGEETSVRKATSVDEVAEVSEIADQATSSSVRVDSEYDDDFASVSESMPDQLVGQTNSSAIVEVEIEEQDIDESGRPSDAGEISSDSEIVEDEPVHHSAEGDMSSDDVVDSDQRKYSDDEFEVSESTPDLLEGQTNSSAIVEVEIEEQDIEESGRPSDAGEIPSDSEILEDEPVQHSVKEDDGCDDVDDSDQRKYSDDEFEDEQLEGSAPPPSDGVLGEQSLSVREDQSSSEDSSTAKLLVAQVATLQHATDETYNPHVLLEDSELASAIETVASQLVTSSDPGKPGSVLTDDKPLAASVSVSVSQSHEEEEESLTKSIEERAARLEVLRQQITARKNEILAVQKRMRVEHRRERLVAEEKLLWSEMESVERLVHADEAALALCRQRNRLDQLYLDAKQQNHSVTGKSNRGSCEQDLDLLIGFDYVEEAQTDEHQKRSLAGLSSASGAHSSTRGVDLLDGYAYVEAVEPINSDPVVGSAFEESAIYHENAERAGVEDDIADGESVRTEGEASQQPIVHNESKDSREDADGEPSTAMMDHEYPSVLAADGALDTESQDSAGECFVRAEKTQPDEADVADGVRLTISQDDREDEENFALVSQEASFQHTYDREVSEELRMSKENTLDHQDASDLLAGYAFVEVAEAASSVQEKLMNGDLLRDFDYVETVKPVELVPVDGINTAELCASGELDDICDDAVVEQNTVRSEATEVSPNASTVPQADAHPHVESVGESVEDADNGSIDDGSLIDAATFVKSDPLASSNAPLARVSRNEEVADRVASLLYADLFQELENDIMSTISYSRNTQQHLYKQKLQGTTHLASTEDIVPGPNDGIDRQVDEVGSRSMDSRYITGWSVDKSSESVEVPAFNMEPPTDECAPEEDAKTRNSNTIVPDDSADKSITDNLDRQSEEEEFPIEVSENEELVERPSSQSSEDGSIQQTASDLISSVREQEADASAEYIPAEEKLRDLISDEAVRSERVADTIFASVFEEVLSSELRFWSRKRPTASSTQPAVQPTAFLPPKTPRGEAKRAPMPDARARDRAAAQQIMDQVEIVDGEIHLPAFDNVDIKADSSTTQVLYDVITDIARDCYDAIQQSLSGETTLNDVSMLAAIQRHVQTELDELLAIREQSEHELERQLQLISDESGAETGLTGDVLLSQNCIASNASSIVSKVQTELSRTTETLSAVQPAHPSLLPRTPVSRAKSTSILSSLQNQQDHELQQRITGMILQDLLLDAGLS